MKTKLLLMLLLISSISFSQLTQSYSPMGPNDFDVFSYNDIDKIKHDKNNVLYAQFRVFNGSVNQYSIRKLNGLVWESVGSSTFPNRPGFFGFDNSNVLYYAFVDTDALNNKLSVVKFNGSIWELVGPAAFTPAAVSVGGISLDFTTTNVPYVAYNDISLGPNPGGSTGSAVVRRFNGTNWVVVGSGGISPVAVAPKIKIDGNNTIYIWYGVSSSSQIIKKFNGFSWVDVITYQNQGFSDPMAFNSNNELHFVNSGADVRVSKINSAGTISQVGPTIPIDPNNPFGNANNIVIDSNNVVYLYGVDSPSIGANGRILRFDGTPWVEKFFTAYRNPTVTIGSDNIPYAHFYDSFSNSSKGYLHKYVDGVWDLVNTVGISDDKANFTSVTIATNNVPHIAYQDVALNGKATVKRYNGTAWTNVGSAGFTPGQAEFTSIKTKNNIPFLVYKDLASSGKASVQKFNGTNWEYVGVQGFSDGAVFSTAIAFGSSDNPYVVYKDVANANKITVKTFNGTAWITLGLAGFSAGEVFDTSIAVTSSNTVYVAYKDVANGNKITVQGFNGTSWQVLGTAGFSTGEANYTKIAVDTGDIPQVVYQDVSLGSKAIVRRFNGVIWQNIGPETGISEGRADFLDIATDNNNLPWIVYRTNLGGTLSKVQVVQVLNYNGQNWLQGSSFGLSRREGDYCSIALNSNNIPVVAYKSQQAFAKFRGPLNTFTLSIDENTISSSKISIYPNPVKSIFSISGSDAVEQVAIFDLLGKEVLNLKNTSQNINIEFLPRGFYIVKVKIENSTSSIKIIKE